MTQAIASAQDNPDLEKHLVVGPGDRGVRLQRIPVTIDARHAVVDAVGLSMMISSRAVWY